MVDTGFHEESSALMSTNRITDMKEKLRAESRYLSLEQAILITRSYQENEGLPRILQRAMSLSKALAEMPIRIDGNELIVGNRTPGIRGGVVFPETGTSWIDEEIETLSSRPQDKFLVLPEDIEIFRKKILPFWQGKSLEDDVKKNIGSELKAIERVVKINQKDHAQGHICPHVEKWLKMGPSGLKNEAVLHLEQAVEEKRDFYKSLILVLDAASLFMCRYGEMAAKMADEQEGKSDLLEISTSCIKLSQHPPETFKEALQSVWFLFVILQMESNASSFSPGRMDQYLYPYYQKDMDAGSLTLDKALEWIEALWLKFNQIVYLRNSHSAKFFAGFPIGFNVAIGGQLPDGSDASNELSFLFLKAQEHIGLPQPNLSARIFKNSPDLFLDECCRVISKGSGMPQIFNDESIIPALEKQGICHADAVDYAIVGCVELTTHGNNLGWSDAAMFNMVKALELALNHGKCLITDEQLGPDTGGLQDDMTYAELEQGFASQLDYFIGKMIGCCEIVEQAHAKLLPSPFLSTVIDDCMEKGLDVTAGGAHYNLSGIQAIQAANIADSLAAIKKLVFDERRISPLELLAALKANFKGHEITRQMLMNQAPKYGNDVEWVDLLAQKWVQFFHDRLKTYRNVRGGPYHTGLYTVSAHVPMGRNVGASADGRFAMEPLADGGMSAMYGRDAKGPTALLKSVSRIDSSLGSNGTLLNMKFLPGFFKTKAGIKSFSSLLKGFCNLNINHVQFNVVSREDLLAAKEHPEKYRNLTIRVAGYTAYFTELAEDLQEEIIARTSYGDGL